MKIVMLAAVTALSLGVGSAYADSVGGQYTTTLFTEIPGFQAHAPTQNLPAVATAQNAQGTHAYVTQSNHGTWLFGSGHGGDGTQG